MSAAIEIVEVEVEEVDRAQALWEGMVSHHTEVVAGAIPVRSPAAAWERRRAQYVEWMESGRGWMLLAVPAAAPAGPALGYAVFVTGPSGGMFALGGEVGDLETLAVAAEARGQGVGGALIEAARAALRDRGVEYWTVSVLEANEDAARLYEREGFRPFYRSLVSRI